MKSKLILIFALALSISMILSSCIFPVYAGDDLMAGIKAADWPEDPEEIDSVFLDALHQFSWNMTKEIASSNGNRMISPLSVYLALVMTLNGADGQTQTDMLTALASQDLQMENLNRAARNLKVYLNETDTSNKLSIVNSIWYRDGFEPDPAFLQSNADYYGAAAHKLDFSDSKSVDLINRWVKQSTEGTIDEIIRSINANTVMFLINAIYFNARWETTFEKKDSFDGVFYASDGNVDARFMKRTGMIKVIQTDACTGVILPYKNDKFGFFALMPNEGTTPGEWIESLDSAGLSEIIDQSVETNMQVILPKFKAEYEIDLEQILTDLGMGIAFDVNDANFSLMQVGRENDLFIQSVTQKTYVRVDELGTEAAAVTKVEIGLKSMPGADLVIRFDRPFFYSIIDMETQVPLFVGVLETP